MHTCMPMAQVRPWRAWLGSTRHAHAHAHVHAHGTGTSLARVARIDQTCTCTCTRACPWHRYVLGARGSDRPDMHMHMHTRMPMAQVRPWRAWLGSTRHAHAH